MSYVHPQKGRRSTKGLSTRDETEAKQICVDLETLVNTPDLWDLKVDDPEILLLHPRAVEIFFDEKPPEQESSIEIHLERAAGRAVAYYAKKRGLKVGTSRIEETDERFDAERKKRLEAERQLAVLRREKKEWLDERARLHRKLNLHCRVKLGDAVAAYENHYGHGHEAVTQQQAISTVHLFKGYIGEEMMIGEIKGSDIDDFVGQLKDRRKKESGTITQVTRGKHKRYLGTFIRWMFKTYDLAENPMDKTGSVAGGTQGPESILAIRRFSVLEDMLKALEPWPYWRAWVAVACLQGPRWSEQTWLKVDDVYLDNNYMRITSRTSGRRFQGTKTGKERNVPLEQKLLRAILEEYIQTRDEEVPWLFPAVDVTNSSFKKNEGRWRDGGQFLNGWRPIAVKAMKDASHKGQHWKFGPKEWRHCAGTAMGHSGLSSLQISQWLGNSEDICRRHYIAPIGSRPWNLSWIADSD